MPLLLPGVAAAWGMRVKKDAARAGGLSVRPSALAPTADRARAPRSYQIDLWRTPLRRQNAKKPRILSGKPLTRAELRAKKLLDQAEQPARLARRRLPVLTKPLTRDGCDGNELPRPCPFVRCVKNLYFTETSEGVIKKTYPDLEPHQMDPNYSCSADIADRGPATVEEIAYAINVTDERVRQIYVGAIAKLKKVDGAIEMLRAWNEER